MEIRLNKRCFSNDFLKPIHKVADRGIFTITKDGVDCLSCSSFDKKDQTIILYSKYISDFELSDGVESVKLNIPNVNKLINVLSFLNEEDITLSVDNNSISYKSTQTGVSFRYHLLEDGVLEAPTVKMDNVYKMGFNFECELSNDTLKTILKGSSFADQTNKIYLYTAKNKFCGILSDDSLQNTDNITFELAESYVGDDIRKKLPMSLEIYRVISSLNFDLVKLKINTEKGIIMFEVSGQNHLLQYIVTSLVK